ncbi:MAG TPA: molybdopterin cofactor-binding domain-containing protein [Burkholderiales bacterium]|jgi:CO/xanthine dehydrogenase Mo-binding subunit|nr:molybdopterin cofactor-binding domain-containing protein [Burkholderiales bacterium]
MINEAPHSAGRRRFMAHSGALIVGFSLLPRGHAQSEAEKTKNTLPGNLKTAPSLDSWIRIDAEGKVTVFTGKAELGQGIKTAIIQVAAEELVVDPRRIMLVTADTALTPNEGYTAGSHSMQDSATAVRQAAADVRELLLGLAAARLNVAADRLTVSDGVVKTDDNRTVRYGELAAGQSLHINATGTAPLRDPARHAFVGKPWPRIDIPAKVTGGAAYVQDMRPDGMAHGRIVRPPAAGATLRDVDTTAVAKLPGVLKIVRDGSFLGVIAEGEYQAVTAMRALSAAARWNEAATKLPEQSNLFGFVRALTTQDQTILEQGSAVEAGNRIEATYLRPYQLHGSIGPSCALAQFVENGCTVWTHSQGVYPLRDALAEMLAMPKESVRCIHVEGSGCYGHNAADDVAADAVLLGRALPGRPVRVQWMREDEHAWEPYGPPMIETVKARLDSSGGIVDWQFEVWSNTHSTRPGKAGDLLAATQLQNAFTPSPPKPLPLPDGGGDRNAIPLYVLPNARIVHHFIPAMPLRASALRSLGAYANIFALESFMDELAVWSKQDSVAFRVRHLNDARAIAVVRLAAERFDWARYVRRRGSGRGFAFARYKNSGAYAAIAMEVQVQRESGIVRVTRVAAAVDSGEAVNPDGIRNQIEGGIIQSLSWTLHEEVRFDRAQVITRDWASYPILRFDGVPAKIEVSVLDRPGQPFLGTGEAAQGPTAAALGNAIADATGVRMRQIPFSRTRIRSTLGA